MPRKKVKRMARGRRVESVRSITWRRNTLLCATEVRIVRGAVNRAAISALKRWNNPVFSIMSRRPGVHVMQMYTMNVCIGGFAVDPTMRALIVSFVADHTFPVCGVCVCLWCSRLYASMRPSSSAVSWRVPWQQPVDGNLYLRN